jgi:predicted metal-dependent hydrolase
MMIIDGIPIEINKKRIKRLYLYVKPPNGAVSVSAPRRMSNVAIERIVRTKVDWIRGQISKIVNQPRLPEMEYVSGERLYVWGRQYLLQVEYGKRYSMGLLHNVSSQRMDCFESKARRDLAMTNTELSNSLSTEEKAVLTVPTESTKEQREGYVREWYRGLLKGEVAKLLPKWENITGLEAKSWQTKYMKTRWGTCNSKTGKIWLNPLLAKKPYESLEYVVLHELIHLIERHHGKRFKMLMDQYMPRWREVRGLLR